MDIVVAANSKYMRYLYVMLISLFDSNKDNEIRIFVLQRDFKRSDMDVISALASSYCQEVVFIDIDPAIFEVLPRTEKFSMETYFRLLLGEKLPSEISRILYLDVDIIVQGSLIEFYNTDFDGNVAVVFKDIDNPVLSVEKRKLFKRTEDMRYFNAGVMLWNMDIIRKDYNFNIFMDAAKELDYNLEFADQEILNYLLYDKVKYCNGNKYNFMVRGTLREKDLKRFNPVVLHYSGCNPWQNGQKNELYRIWWRYAKRTPYYLELLEENLYRGLDFSEERVIYEKAFLLKGTGRIREVIENFNVRIGIYGAGKMATVLYELLTIDGVWNAVDYVVDKGSKKCFYGIEITKNIIEDKNTIWIVTPLTNNASIINDICEEAEYPEQIISMTEWLKSIVDQ